MIIPIFSTIDKIGICRGESLMKRIEFKYHPNLYSDEILIHEEGVCNCCGRKVPEYGTLISTACLRCIEKNRK